MLDIFNLDSYKEYLISYYFYDCDHNDIKRLERKRILERNYTDDNLQSIVDNTKEFILNILDNTTDNYVSIELAKNEEYIFTNCTGGHHPDILMPIDETDKSFKISKYLLEKFLGREFMVYLDEEEIEYFDDNEDLFIGCSYFIPKLIISGNFSEKREKLNQENQKELVRVLKRIFEN